MSMGAAPSSLGARVRAQPHGCLIRDGSRYNSAKVFSGGGEMLYHARPRMRHSQCRARQEAVVRHRFLTGVALGENVSPMAASRILTAPPRSPRERGEVP